MAEGIRPVTAAELQELIASGKPMVVDFWAHWCAPCKALAPTLAAVAAEYAGKVETVSIDVDQEAAVASQYQVRGIPTLVVFKAGAVADKVVGIQQRPQLEKLFQGLL